MSAPNSIIGHHHQEPALDKRNNNTIKMSAANYMTATTNDNSASPIDLIGSKFDELANKILNELKQSNYSREFFQAIDVILNEPTPSTHQQNVGARRLSNQIKQQQQKTKRLKETTAAANAGKSQTDSIQAQVGVANMELKKQCELIMEKQRQQQEQLDNHQQILFDSQYRSLPAEITEAVAGHEQRRANAKALPQKTPVTSLTAPRTLSPSLAPKEAGDIVGKAPSKQQTVAPGTLQQQQQPISKFGGAKAAPLTRSKENLATTKGGSSVVSKEQRQRSAIPQSISHKVEGPVYPITKSATVGGSDGASAVTASELGPSGLLGTGLVRQASLRLNKQTRETQQEFIKQQTRPLAASEKLKQRRPTKASLVDRQRPTRESDDDLDDDGDDDDDDDEFEYQNLASRRAYLNQRFIGQQQQQDSSTPKANEPAASTQAGRLRQQVTSTIQSGVKQASMNTANMTVAKQKQRFSNEAQVVRSNTIGGSQMARPSASTRQQGSKPIDNEPADQHEPRSLGGLLTSHDISQLYKPHMNYSTSLLGNHRLSDDDEIIIIPTAQSPSLMSASVSPVNPHNHHHQHTQPDDEHPDRTTNNIDEFSERFSISRTKSFWEKLANSKSGGGAGEDAKGNNPSPQHDKQYFNSSQRSLSSGPNLVADSKSSQCSLLNQGGHGTGQAANGHHYPAAMKSAFDRMDSTGGSGNSHYSGCSSSSSTSGDEQTLTGHMNLAERRSMLVSAATGANKSANRQRASGSGGGGQPPNASMNPTINQLVQQDQINRSDRFRQTR